MRRRYAKRYRRSAAAEMLESRAMLTTFVVTSLADNLADDGETTLREAIQQAEAEGGDQEIVFQTGLSGPITMSLGQFFTRESNLTITGNGRDETIIDADGKSDIFYHEGRTTLSLQSMTLRNAQQSAVIQRRAGYYVGVSIRDALITGSQGTAVDISAYLDSGYTGSLSIRDSTITGNAGAGVRADAAVNGGISDSIISDNSGGGVFVGGYSDSGSPRFSINRSIVRDNTSAGHGGGIHFQAGELSVFDSLVTGNDGTNGGGVYVGYDAYEFRLERSTVSGNTATAKGGGIFLKSAYGQKKIRNSTISGNTAMMGGGAYFEGGDYSPEIRNSTITLNGASDRGGGLFVASSLTRAVIESNIVANNTANAGSPDLVLNSTFEFRNNLLGSNDGTNLQATGSNAPDADGNLVGSPDNLIDPQLSGLVDVGILRVHQLLASSPAIDRGANPSGLSVDQVGNPRQTGSAVDIGAVEVEPGPWTVSNVSAAEGNSGITTFVFTVELNEAASGPFTLDAMTVDGTATASLSDYASASQTLSFSGTAGEMQQFAVAVSGDTRVEADQNFYVDFGNISDSSITPPSRVQGIILNDDASDRIRLQGSRLMIDGTSQPDSITIKLLDDESTVEVVVNDDSAELVIGDFFRVEVDAKAGDDRVTTTSMYKPMLIDVGDGNDTVKGGPGRDTILGRDGDDKLRGTQGDDEIFGGNGNDSLQGQVGSDTLIGGDGDDTLKGAEDNDTLRGDAGNDLIEGGDGDDTLVGAGGNDTLFGEAGADRMRGGGGNDLQVGGAGDDRAGGGNGADTMIGGDGNDYLNAGAGPDQLVGGTGNDTLRGRNGDDVLLGEDGDDFLKGLTGRDIVYGGNGTDELFGNGGEDILIAGSLTTAEGTTILEHLSGDLRDEWLSSRPYTQRVENIRNGPGATGNRLNTTYLIGDGRSGQNVFDDTIADNLHSGNELDLFFARVGTDVLDSQPGEFTEGI